MPYCRNCGAQVPVDAMFCPKCGAPVEVKPQLKPDTRETALKYFVIGLIGAFLSTMISTFSPGIDLYFLPSFVSSIFIIYVYRVNEFKESLIATFVVYLFADGILGTLVLGQYYFLNETIAITPQLWDVVVYPLNPVSAFIAAYIGARVSPRRREEHVLVPYKREEGPGGVIYNL